MLALSSGSQSDVGWGWAQASSSSLNQENPFFKELLCARRHRHVEIGKAQTLLEEHYCQKYPVYATTLRLYFTGKQKQSQNQKWTERKWRDNTEAALRMLQTAFHCKHIQPSGSSFDLMLKYVTYMKEHIIRTFSQQRSEVALHHGKLIMTWKQCLVPSELLFIKRDDLVVLQQGAPNCSYWLGWKKSPAGWHYFE